MTTFTVSGTDTTAKTLTEGNSGSDDTGTITSAGNLNVATGTAITLALANPPAGAGVVITNAGTIQSQNGRTIDAAGNVGVASAPLAFTVDTIAPVAPTGLADAAVVNGFVDAANDTATQTLTGSAEAGSTVSVYDGTAKLGTTTATNGGTFSYTLGKLADGSHSLTATATDTAGNIGTASAPLAFTVDTVAPAAPTDLADAAVVDGMVNAAHDTSAQTLTGSAEAGSAVTVCNGSTELGTTKATNTGAFSYTLGKLADGSHSLKATATDAAGNIGTASAALAFTVDTVAPTANSIAAALQLGQSADLTAAILAAVTPGHPGDTLRIVGDNVAGTDGTVSLVNGDLAYTAAGAGLSYIPANGSLVDHFGYTVADQYGDTASAGASITVSNPASVITGRPRGHQTLQGTAGADIINASGLFNIINDNGGNDVVDGGRGHATVNAGDGDVTVHLHGLFDRVSGGNGWDTVSGSAGRATVSLGDGNDAISTGGFFNHISVGAGSDTIVAGSGRDTVAAGARTDAILLAGRGNTVTLNGSTATVSGGQGFDTVTATGGADSLAMAGPRDRVSLDGQITASIADLGIALRIGISSNAQNDTISGFGSHDQRGVIDLHNGAGGYASVSAILQALHDDGHGGTMLALDATHSIDFVATAASQLHASNFKIG